MTPEKIRDLWSSGFVNRWHTHNDARLRNSQDTNDAHSARVAKLYIVLAPLVGQNRRASELGWCILHDVPEKVTGDIAYETKRIHPEIKPYLDDMSAMVWEHFDIGEVIDTPLGKLCDQLDATLFADMVAPDLLARPDWVAQTVVLLDRAEALGIRRVVSDLVNWRIRDALRAGAPTGQSGDTGADVQVSEEDHA